MLTLGHLDANITTVCQRKCVSCSHMSPLTTVVAREFMEPETLQRDLALIKPVVRFRIIQIIGGEPLLAPKLLDMLRVARESGVSDDVSIITNADLLPRMKDSFWDALQYLQVYLQISQYPDLPQSTIDLAKSKCELYGIPLGISVFNEFYVALKPEETDGHDVFDSCHWKTDCYSIDNGKFHMCAQSIFIPHTLQGLPKGIDGLPLEGLTEDGLKAFLARKEPLNACRRCSGGFSEKKPWSESPSRADWIARSTAK